jgi:hypothetical protein
MLKSVVYYFIYLLFDRSIVSAAAAIIQNARLKYSSWFASSVVSSLFDTHLTVLSYC